MMKNKRLVDEYLTEARDTNRKLTIIITNGYQMIAEVVDFDDEAISIVVNNHKELIFRKAISTIKPAP